MNNNYLTLTLLIIFLSGCGTIISVPLDDTVINKQETTIIIYHQQGYSNEFNLFMDKEIVGVVTSKEPLKISVPPGEHSFHTGLPIFIDRVTKKHLLPNKIYYFIIWIEHGMWVSSVWVTPTHKVESYETRVRNP